MLFALLASGCGRAAAPSPIATSSALPLGRFERAELPGGHTVYLPVQPPTESAMMALLEGMLVERDGCLRVTTEGYADGFLILWPHGSTSTWPMPRSRCTMRLGGP